MQGLQVPHIRNASLEDYGRISVLQRRNNIPETPRERWINLWLGNPAFKRRRAESPIGWILETAENDIVGFIGNIPLIYRLGGQVVHAATATSWVVDREYRGYSTLILERFIKQKGIDLLVFTTVSPDAEPLLNSLRFSQVPVGTWNTSAFWIVSNVNVSRSILRAKSVPFVRALCYPVAGVLSCHEIFRRLRITKPVTAPSYGVEQASEFDARFDQFWEELKHQNEDVLLAVRTRETLAWHFQDALSRQNAWVLAASNGQRIIAYAAFDRQDNRALGLRRIRLVDFQALKGSENALPLLLSSALSKCRQRRIDMMEIVGDWLNRPNLPEIIAPYQRKLSSWIWYYKAKDTHLSETLREPRAWAPSLFDGDASL